MEPRSSGPGHRPGTASSTAAAEPDDDVVVTVADRRWHRLVPGVERIVRRAAREAARTGPGAAIVVLDGDRAVRRLNARYRGRNRPTNVLTFEPAPGSTGGDIVLALGVVRREALAENKRPAHHLAHLVVHGVLHLRGHDHGGAGEARRMEAAEARILARLGVPNPWKPRARADDGATWHELAGDVGRRPAGDVGRHPATGGAR